VNNLPKVVMQLLPGVGFEPMTYRSRVQLSTRCTIVHVTWVCYMSFHKPEEPAVLGTKQSRPGW